MPFFLSKRKEKSLPVTDERMTRFNITLQGGVNLVLHAIEHAFGGEIFIPKIPSYKINILAKAIAPNAKIEIVGIRPGEKLHEEMITSTDSLNTYDCGKYYVIAPLNEGFSLKEFIGKYDAKKVPDGFQYSSGTNKEWLDEGQLRKLIKEHVDPDFSWS